MIRIFATKITYVCHLLLLVSSSLYADSACHTPDVKKLVSFVEKNRNLKITDKSPCQVVSHDFFQKTLEERLRSQYVHRSIVDEGKIFKLFKIIPNNYDYARCLIKENGSGTTAFYDHKINKIVFANNTALSESTLVHELVHMAQDQNFNLDAYDTFFQSSTDEALTVAIMAESEAVSSQLDFEEEYKIKFVSNQHTKSDSCTMPEKLVSMFSFPYVEGVQYFKNVLSNGGFENVNAFWSTDLIYGTAQILYNWNRQAISENLDLKRKFIAKFDKLHGKAQYRDSLGALLLNLIFEGSIAKPFAWLQGLMFDRIYMQEILGDGNKQDKIIWYLYYKELPPEKLADFKENLVKLIDREVQAMIIDNNTLKISFSL